VAERVAARTADHAAAAAAIRANGAAVVTATLNEAVALANRIAPEHLVCDDDRTARRVTTAGTTFVGGFAAQAAGDYATGSNHVLPTAGAARFRGGLRAADFVRVSSVQRVSRTGLAGLASIVTTLAGAEGLRAHAASIDARMEP
jgi:histidinol dehydrogenase